MKNMNNDLEGQLQNEIEKGKQARQAYESYLRAYIERMSTEIYADFVSANSDVDSYEIMQIKYRHDALLSLENNILRDIETGKIAEHQLSTME